MPQFVLFLHEPPAARGPISPEEMQAVIRRYKAWRDKVAEKGHMRGGHKLVDGTGRVLRHSGVTDGPYTETKELIAGLFLIEAQSYEEALAIANDCPHLDWGTIEIRQIDVVG